MAGGIVDEDFGGKLRLELAREGEVRVEEDGEGLGGWLEVAGSDAIKHDGRILFGEAVEHGAVAAGDGTLTVQRNEHGELGRPLVELAGGVGEAEVGGRGEGAEGEKSACYALKNERPRSSEP